MIFLFIILPAIFLAIAALPVYNLFFATAVYSPHKVLLISHRGAGGLAPENTMPAIDSGIANKANILEIDIHQSLDSQLVVIHDRSVDRTTNGRGDISQLTYAQINQLNTVGSLTSNYGQVKIPLLREVLLRVAASNVELIIEIKDPKNYPGLVPRLVNLIHETNTLEKVFVFSFDIDVIKEIKLALPGVRTGFLCLGVENLDNYEGADFISPNMWSVIYHPSIVQKIHRKNCKVFVWTVDSPFFMKYLIRQNVDGIITNRPDLFHKVVNSQ
jgi:glycerophosphoryl diester phosphodiesterase